MQTYLTIAALWGLFIAVTVVPNPALFWQPTDTHIITRLYIVVGHAVVWPLSMIPILSILWLHRHD